MARRGVKRASVRCQFVATPRPTRKLAEPADTAALPRGLVGARHRRGWPLGLGRRALNCDDAWQVSGRRSLVSIHDDRWLPALPTRPRRSAHLRCRGRCLACRHRWRQGLSAQCRPHSRPHATDLAGRFRRAWAARRDGACEVFVAPTDGGVFRRLTHWGQPGTRVTGWVSDAEVMVLSGAGQGLPVRMFAHAVPVDGGPSRRLPYGWAGDVAVGPDGGVLLSSFFWTERARWKHYRGGPANQLWLDLAGSGTFRRIFADLSSSLAFPVWTTGADGRQRIGFCSDHEGRGQFYSAVIGRRAPTTSRLACRTDSDFYVRHASSDGRQVVYCAGGDVFLHESLDDGVEPRRVDLRIGGARPLLRPRRSRPPATSARSARIGPAGRRRSSPADRQLGEPPWRAGTGPGNGIRRASPSSGGARRQPRRVG